MRSFIVRSVSVPWSGSVDVDVFNELSTEDLEAYCLDEDFFPDFINVYKKNVYEFGGIIEGDISTAKALVGCLNIWSAHLTTLRLQPRAEDSFYKRDSLSILSKAISQLPNLTHLFITSEIFALDGVNDGSFNKLTHLQYNFAFVDDFFAFMSLFISNWATGRTLVLPRMQTLNVGYVSLVETATEECRVRTMLDYMPTFFSCCRDRNISFDEIEEPTGDQAALEFLVNAAKEEEEEERWKERRNRVHGQPC